MQQKALVSPQGLLDGRHCLGLGWRQRLGQIFLHRPLGLSQPQQGSLVEVHPAFAG